MPLGPSPLLLFLRVGLRLCVVAAAFLGLAAMCLAADEVLAPRADAVAEVRSGRREVAHAAWWGFDPADATRSLQAALISRAKKIVVENMGRPWIVSAIDLPGDKEIVFDPGVVVEAKRGEFLGKNDCLFAAKGRKRLTLRGDGATFRMHKDDYHRPPYQLAEWRHALSIRGCQDVLVEGLTLRDSGGDGIYLGAGSDGATNRNVTIRNVICDSNNRQGISVITAENLQIEDCVFRGTQGTAPQAGIDFEPNRPTERLAGCVLRNCRSENNAGHAYHLYLGHMDHTSTPVSIRFEHCTSKGCGRYSTYVGVANREGKPAVRGRIEYVDCRFDADEGAGVYIRGNEADGCLVRFQQCEIVRRDQQPSRLAPITIEAPRQLDIDAGNIRIEDCTIRDSLVRQPIAWIASPITRLRNVTGSLTVDSPDGQTTFAIDAEQLRRWFPQAGLLARIPRFPFDWTTARRLAARSEMKDPVATFRLRRQATLLVWAEAERAVKLVAKTEPVGRHTPSTGTMTMTARSGETTRLDPDSRDGQLHYTFTPAVTAPHLLQWRGDSKETFCPIDCSVPIGVLGEPVGAHFIRPIGTLRFSVPAGVERFALLVSGSGTAETVKATVRDASGKVVETQDNIAAPHVFVLECDSTATDEPWSLTLEKASEGVLEDVSIQAVGIPPVFMPAHTTEDP